jgi:glycosyltransferase involved in cell wall biosynthesis
MSGVDPSVAGFVVTWNRPESLRRSLEALLSQTWPPDAIFVVDNGDGDAASKVTHEVGSGRIGYRRTGQNLGPAGGVAYGMRWLTELGFDWILVTDDDDPLSRDDILEGLRLIIRRRAVDRRLGAVAVTGFRWDWRRGRPTHVFDDELHGDVRVDIAPANQFPIIRREVIEAVGPFHEDLFFGRDDDTFFLRMGKAGWYLLADGEAWAHVRRQKALRGERRPGRVRRHLQLHGAPSWRGYYDTRNYITEMRRVFGRPDLARREVGRAMARSARSWLGGPRHGTEVTRLQTRAVFDAYRGRLGRTVEPVPKAH